MRPPDLLARWARLLMGSLHRAGVRDVVLSPGSRSTPFTWAALQEPGFRCHTIIDERSAAFFALGHARMTGDPVLLVCTSGSAAANYFPAIVEAGEAAVPLLVLTADRPLELQSAAAPQTIDQVKLYGDRVRAYVELGAPDADPRMLRALPRLAAQAVLASRAPVPGPVHINARARKPLEPPPDPPERDASGSDAGLIERTPSAVPPDVRPAPAAIREAAAACRGAARGLIVCGPATPVHAADPEAVAALSRATGYPVVAEAASQVRFAGLDPSLALGAFDELLDVPGFAAGHAPDVVIQVGRPPTASSWSTAVEAWPDVVRVVLSPWDWADPWSTATALVRAPLTAGLRALLEALPGNGRGDAGWRKELHRLDGRAREILEASLAEGFSEAAAVRQVVDGLPPHAVLAVGNSLPIREVTTFVPPGDRAITVWSQRGANGIDGLISGAAGAASGSARPVTLLVGDVAFVHDLGGLRAARDLPAPLTIVVLNNGGGRIFERLPIASMLAGDPALDAWLTPPEADIRAAASVFGHRYARGTDRASLAAALAETREGGIVEVVVPDGGTTDHQRDIGLRLRAALEP